MKRKIAALCAAVAVLALVHVYVMPLDRLFLFLISERTQCGPDDTECLERVKAVRGNCTPSVSVVTVGNGTNNITIRVATFMRDGKCVTEEIVLDDSGSGLAPFDITGYNTTCEIPQETFEEFGQKACNGSLLSFVSPDGKVPSTAVEGEEDVFTAYCSLDAQDCKEEASEYVRTCTEAQITMDMEISNTEGGASYWTIFIDIDRLPVEYTETKKLQPRCSIYYELVNAVNLPPDLPPEMIGMNMTCTINLDEFPIDWVVPGDCEGGLRDFIELLYP